jgi:hypothetical protein
MDASRGDAMFDVQLAAAGAAVEVCANMSALANYHLSRAKDIAQEAGIDDTDQRYRGLSELLSLWEDRVTPAFNEAVQRDPTGPRGAQVTRPWRDPEFAPV